MGTAIPLKLMGTVSCIQPLTETHLLHLGPIGNALTVTSVEVFMVLPTNKCVFMPWLIWFSSMPWWALTPSISKALRPLTHPLWRPLGP